MKKVLCSVLSVCMVFFSCKKDENEDPNVKVAPTPTQILTTRGWIMNSSVSIIAGSNEVDLLELLPACQKDNIYYFRSDQTAVTDEGLTKCNPIDPQQKVSGTWLLFENDTKIRFISTDSIVIIADFAIDNTTLILNYETYANNIKSTTKTIYKRK